MISNNCGQTSDKTPSATPQALLTGGCDTRSHARSHEGSQVKVAVLKRLTLLLRGAAGLNRLSPASLPTSSLEDTLALRRRRCCADGSQVKVAVLERLTLHLRGAAGLNRLSPVS